MYIEPNADIKTMAATAKQFYNAFIEVGFTKSQAFELTTKIIIAASANSSNKE